MVFKLTDYLDKRKVSTQSVPVVKEANQIINEFVKTVNKDLIVSI